MTEEQFKGFYEYFIERNNIRNVDCISEVSAIADKKSNLSKMQRDSVSAVVAYAVKSGMKDYLVEHTVADKLDKCFPDIYDIPLVRKESWESALTKFVKANENYKFDNPPFMTVSKLECFVLFYAIFKLFPKIESKKGNAVSIVNNLDKEQFDQLYKKSKKLIENAIDLAKKNEELQKLFTLKLLF